MGSRWLARCCARPARDLAGPDGLDPRGPPFRGMDEFEHVFRAAGVASGQWQLTEPVEDARGLWSTARGPPGRRHRAVLVAALHRTHDLRGRRARQRLGAGGERGRRLQPGVLLGRRDRGRAHLRGDGVVRHAVHLRLPVRPLIAASAAAVRTWAPGPWVVVGMVLGTSPTLLYSTTVVAPNGLEMAAGLCLWASLLGLGAPGVTDRTDPGGTHRLLRRPRSRSRDCWSPCDPRAALGRPHRGLLALVPGGGGGGPSSAAGPRSPRR